MRRTLNVLERSLYNNILAGVSLGGDRFFYVNPLAADGQHKFNQGLAERFAWTGCPCCPVNLVRLIPQVGDYFYAVRGDEVFVNLFAASRARIRLAAGELRMLQETRYPLDGRVRIQVSSAPEQPITLRVRIPGWARGRPVPGDLYRYSASTPESVALRLNGQSLPISEKQGYALVRRVWHGGDRLELLLPMPVRRVFAHVRVVADRGCVALERGPLVYCVEGIDHGGQVSNLVLPDDAPLKTSSQSALLGGATLIEAKGQRIAIEATRRVEPASLKFIPYYAWNHRGAGSMTVWLPRSNRDARAP